MTGADTVMAENVGRATGSIPAGRRLASWVLVALMAAGSIAMWLVNPVAWVWLASRLQKSSQPSLGPYMLVLVGVIVTAVVLTKTLGALNRRHAALTGRDASRRAQLPWLKSMRGERDSGREGGVLEVVMVISVGAAATVSAIWFFAFAGSSLPS